MRPHVLFCFIKQVVNLKCELHEWWDTIKTSANVDYVAGEVETCVNKFFDDRAHACDCNEKDWKHFPLAYFYQGSQADRLMVCDSGLDEDKLCHSDDECKQPSKREVDDEGAAAARCLLKYPDARRISENVDYGCFFTGPTARYELGFSFKKCNFREAVGTITTSGGALTRDQVPSCNVWKHVILSPHMYALVSVCVCV